MSFFKPHAYIDYIPPKLAEGKEWYVHYSVRNPQTGKMKRFKIKVNRWKTTKERRAAARSIIAYLSEKLAFGWNPILEQKAPKSYTGMFEALDLFLKVKGNELEENSMRSYISFIKGFKEYLLSSGFEENMYVVMFDKQCALDYLGNIELEVSPRTYNNYIKFLRTLFNWFKSRGFISVSPFDDIKKKPRRLIKKNRRIFADEEISTLFSFLEKENPYYMAMCLLCYCCFLRPKELVLLRCGDIDLFRQIIRVSEEIAKNDHESTRTIPTVILPYLQKLDYSDKNKYLFGDNEGFDFSPSERCADSRKIARYWSDVVRQECHFPMELQFYSLKDTGITKMIGEGTPISFVQQQADHSSIAMTAIYLQKNISQANAELKQVDILSK